MKSKISAIESKKFHGYGFEKPLQFLKDNIASAERVELFPTEKIVFLDIPFGELYHRCNDLEWQEFIAFLSVQGIAIRKKRLWWFS